MVQRIGNLSIIFLFLLVWSVSPLPADESNEPDVLKTKELRREIILLNLINGLYLSPEQMLNLIPKIEEAEKIRQEYQSKLSWQARLQEEALAELREELIEKQAPSTDVARRAGKLNHELRKLHKEMMTRLIEVEEVVKEILNENQLALIEDFAPCILPKKSTTSPVRIGQAAGDTTHLERLLSRIRQMDEWRYLKRRERIVSRMIDRYEEHVALLTDEERDKLKTKYLEVLEEARSMSDLDFELKKPELAAEILPSKSGKNHRRRKYELSKVGKFMLDGRLIPILEEKLKLVNTSPQL